MGIWPGHRGYTPTLYKKCHGIFLLTTESQDLGLMSHPKDGIRPRLKHTYIYIYIYTELGSN